MLLQHLHNVAEVLSTTKERMQVPRYLVKMMGLKCDAQGTESSRRYASSVEKSKGGVSYFDVPKRTPIQTLGGAAIGGRSI